MLKVLVVEPKKAPYVKEIDRSLSSFQAEVGGDIEAIFPFDDPVMIICNEEGKNIGLLLNRAMRDEDGKIWDIISGTFLIVGLGDASLSDELIDTYSRYFETPEVFANVNGQIVVMPL